MVLMPSTFDIEHFAIAVHIFVLFRSIILHCYVPKVFRSGIVIPLIKARTGDVNKANNYRGVTLIPVIFKLFELVLTLIPVISKLFELVLTLIPVISKRFEFVLIEICAQFLSCDELQFGFKKGFGCSEAMFALRSTIDYFKDRGSSILVAALDISKAFDTVNHYKLYA